MSCFVFQFMPKTLVFPSLSLYGRPTVDWVKVWESSETLCLLAVQRWSTASKLAISFRTVALLLLTLHKLNPAFFIISFDFVTIEIASSRVSAPHVISSAYIRFKIEATRGSSSWNNDACLWIVASRIDGLGFKPKGSRQKRSCMTEGSALCMSSNHRKRNKSLSDSLMLIWWKAFCISAVKPITCVLKRMIVSKRKGIKLSPWAKRSLREGVSFDSFALPSNTILTFVVSWSWRTTQWCGRKWQLSCSSFSKETLSIILVFNCSSIIALYSSYNVGLALSFLCNDFKRPKHNW